MESGKEILIVLCGLREHFDEEWFSVLIDDTDSEVILRDINAYIIVDRPTNLLRVEGQGDRLLLGLCNPKKWSPCPSLFESQHSYNMN